MRNSRLGKNLLRSAAAPAVLFSLAAALVAVGGINVVRAAPAIQSNWYGAQVELDDIDVAITENGTVVHGDDALLNNLVPKGEAFAVGRTYPEVLAVRNAQNALNQGKDGKRIIDEYVRVTVYKYWVRTGKDGKPVKAPDLDPALIDLHFVEGNGWTIDRAASSPERTVLYYSTILGTDEKTRDSTPFADTLTIDSKVFDTDGYQDATFRIDAVVHAVQTHNADDARLSAWGQIDAAG